jgi:hypothetical protein
MVWLGCYVIKELVNVVIDGLCVDGLLLVNFSEWNNEFVVYSADIVEQGPNDRLNARDFVFVQSGVIGRPTGITSLGAIDDKRVLVMRVLGFGWEGVVAGHSEVSDAVAYQEATYVGNIVPVKVDTRVEVTLLVDCDVVLFF